MKKNLFNSLLILITLISCDKGFQYPIYKEGETKVAQLLLKDSLHSIAHILDYHGNLWEYRNEKKDVVERIADFYNIHGYEIFLYDTLKYNLTKMIDKSFEECLRDSLMPYNDHILPYDYRMNYINAKGDTIGKLLWRYNGEGVLYTPSVLKEVQLESIIRYFKLKDCRIYNHKTKDLYSKKDGKGTQYIGCYAFFIGNEVLFRDTQRDTLQIDGITITLKNETSKYLKYYSDKELNLNQILKVLNEIGLPKEIVYFYKHYTELEYASCVYFESKNWYRIGMFTTNKSYIAKYSQSASWRIISD